MENDEQRFSITYFWMKNWGSKKIHQGLVTGLGTDAHGRFQIKIWIQKFRNGHLSCQDTPGTGRPPLTLGGQLKAFLQKCPFASARVLAQHFLTTVPTVKEVLQRKLGLKYSRGTGCRMFYSPPKKLFVLKHQQRYYKLCTSRKSVILREPPQMTSPISNIPIRPQKCLQGR
jgi:transposase